MKLKLLAYDQYSSDQYTAAIATVMYNDELVLTFAQKRTKAGGLFWCPASTSISEGGEKLNIKSFYFDSQFKQQQFENFIKSAVKNPLHESLAGQLKIATDALNSLGGDPEGGIPF